MTDIGLQLVESLYEQMMIDEQWAMRRERGFTWWSFRLAQHVEVGPQFWSSDRNVCEVRIWTEVVNDVDSGRNPAAVLAAVNMHATLNALVWDRAAATITECCTAVVHEQNFAWLSKELAMAAVLQNTAAHSRAHGLAEACGGVAAATDHPVSGHRPAMDDILNVPEQVVVSEGGGPSRFAGPRMAQVQNFLTQMQFLGTADANEITCEVPFTGTTPAIAAAAMDAPDFRKETSLVQLFTDAPHPQFGSGALLLMRLPIDTDPSQVALMANKLNLAEAKADQRTMLLGAWCPDPTSDSTVAFCSFVPNALASLVIAENLISQQSNRSLFAAEFLRAS